MPVVDSRDRHTRRARRRSGRRRNYVVNLLSSSSGGAPPCPAGVRAPSTQHPASGWRARAAIVAAAHPVGGSSIPARSSRNDQLAEVDDELLELLYAGEVPGPDLVQPRVTLHQARGLRASGRKYAKNRGLCQCVIPAGGSSRDRRRRSRRLGLVGGVPEGPLRRPKLDLRGRELAHRSGTRDPVDAAPVSQAVAHFRA